MTAKKIISPIKYEEGESPSECQVHLSNKSNYWCEKDATYLVLVRSRTDITIEVEMCEEHAREYERKINALKRRAAAERRIRSQQTK